MYWRVNCQFNYQRNWCIKCISCRFLSAIQTKLKKTILSVPDNILEQYGAVSEETVIAMAKGALKQSKSDFVIAVSGIAGPDGGTNEKPVGLGFASLGALLITLKQFLCITQHQG